MMSASPMLSMYGTRSRLTKNCIRPCRSRCRTDAQKRRSGDSAVMRPSTSKMVTSPNVRSSTFTWHHPLNASARSPDYSPVRRRRRDDRTRGEAEHAGQHESGEMSHELWRFPLSLPLQSADEQPVSLPAGARLGPYEILTLIGAGETALRAGYD